MSDAQQPRGDRSAEGSDPPPLSFCDIPVTEPRKSAVSGWSGNAGSWRSQVADPQPQGISPPPVPDQPTEDEVREQRLVEVESQLKDLRKRSQNLLNESIELRECLEQDFDPPDVRLRDQYRYLRVGKEQDALVAQIRELEAERKRLRPEWKNVLEVVGGVFGVIFGLLFIFGGGAMMSGAISFSA